MTLGQDIAAALPALRAQAESMMTGACTITRPGVPTPENWNPVTLQYDITPVSVYTGKCRLRPSGQQDRGTDAAGQVFVESSYVLSLPVIGSESVAKDDLVTVTAADDPVLVGRVFTVVVDPAYMNGTARRVPVREAQ